MQNSKAKMDEFKTKFMDLLHKQTNRQVKIPAMGFSDYFVQNVTADVVDDTKVRTTTTDQKKDEQDAEDATVSAINQKSDQEILESIEEIYYKDQSNPQLYELKKVLKDGVSNAIIEETMNQLRMQHKILSKQVLQNILEQRSACNKEFLVVNDIQKDLEQCLWTCRKARSYLKFAKTNLTTTSLEILASYRKREVLQEVLNTLNAIKQLKTTDSEVQKFLRDYNYSGAISLLLKCKDSAEAFMEYNCVQSLNKKLQETLLLTEFQLDTVLNEMVLNYDMKKYSKLQEAYKLLNKSLIAMDQLHINFISAIHSSVNAVIRSYNDPNIDENYKYLYEQLCEHVTAEKYIHCLISLCKTIWTILASYYQIVLWHQNYKLYPIDMEDSPDTYIQEKLRKGQSRIWNDILTKICIFLQSSKMKSLKFDQFIQVLSINQRLKKVGLEFCGEQSEKLIETMQIQSEEFFKRYHITCLEEICLFLDNESWTVVDSFANILQLPEFRSIKNSLGRHKSPPLTLIAVAPSPNTNNSPTNVNPCDELVSVHSQDGGSSIYGSYGYFLRFSEKSSPFDGGLDVNMLEEDILSGIIDEASCYFSEDSDDEKAISQMKDFEETNNGQLVIVNNTTLNVFRCIGRYLQMCKLLHSISPKIVASILELMDFYAYAVHEIFGKDSSVQMEKFYSSNLEEKLKSVEENILPNIKIWPLNFSSLINNELANPDTLHGLSHRIVAIESGCCMTQQFLILQHYLNHLLASQDRTFLNRYLDYIDYMKDISKPVYTCVTSRVMDLQAILALMGKVKWDVGQLSLQHNSYIDIMNRNIQTFAMRLEEIAKEITIPSEQIWNSMAHVATRLLVEGFSNMKKCSPCGRALMQLDLTNFMSLMELISQQKFPEHRAYVDTYIKVYYYSMEQLEEWIEEQRNLDLYSTKQLISVVQCTCVAHRKTRQKLTNLLQENNTTGNILNLSINLNTSLISLNTNSNINAITNLSSNSSPKTILNTNSTPKTNSISNSSPKTNSKENPNTNSNTTAKIDLSPKNNSNASPKQITNASPNLTETINTISNSSTLINSNTYSETNSNETPNTDTNSSSVINSNKNPETNSNETSITNTNLISTKMSNQNLNTNLNEIKKSNENTNTKSNEITNSNSNEKTNSNENINSNENTNSNQNENTNSNENKNANSKSNENTNTKLNENTNSNESTNTKLNENTNTNSNENTNTKSNENTNTKLNENTDSNSITTSSKNLIVNTNENKTEFENETKTKIENDNENKVETVTENGAVALKSPSTGNLPETHSNSNINNT